MTRAEHLQWCKDRALVYVEAGDLSQAFASFSSDMGKHGETQNHPTLFFGAGLLLNGYLGTAQKMREWIVGFN